MSVDMLYFTGLEEAHMFLDILSRDTYQAYFTEREDSV